MTKRIVLALGCIVLLATFTSTAMADGVTFHFGGRGVVVAIPAAFTATFTKLVNVEDTDTSVTIPAIGGASLVTGAVTSSTYTPGVVKEFAFGPGGHIVVKSGAITLLTGNTVASGTGIMSLHNGRTGSISGDFDVTYVNPIVLSAFGVTGQIVDQIGAWSLNTNHDVATSNTFGATISGGAISFDTTAVPEPGTLALMGSSIFGLAGVLRRKLML